MAIAQGSPLGGARPKTLIGSTGGGRCNVENLGSRALRRGLGFQQVIELEAFTFTAA